MYSDKNLVYILTVLEAIEKLFILGILTMHMSFGKVTIN